MCPALNGRAFCDDSSAEPELEYPELKKSRENSVKISTKEQETSLCACAWSPESCKCCTDDENDDDR